MSFTPIALEDYIASHLQVNPQVQPADLRRRLRRALADFKAGRKCRCGNPLWVIGSAEVGNACFTCITGETATSGDYELEEALAAPSAEPAAPAAPGDAARKSRLRRHHRSRHR